MSYLERETSGKGRCPHRGDEPPSLLVCADCASAAIARLQAKLAEARARIAGAYEAFNSILCNAVEGPEVVPAADLFQTIAKEANTAMRSLSGTDTLKTEIKP